MTWWTLEPRDPLLVRDARPFSARASVARSMDFPLPSVTAGAFRTRVGFALRTSDQRSFALTPSDARTIRVRGPMLAQVRSGKTVRCLFTAPRDAVLFDRGSEPDWPCYALAPSAREDATRDHLPDQLTPVMPAREMPVAKAARDAPAFWSAGLLADWLAAPDAVRTVSQAKSAPALVHERRVHVAIDPETGTALDGALFETDGLRFRTGIAKTTAASDGGDSLRLLVQCAHEALQEGHQQVGGERRLSVLEQVQGDAPLGLPRPRLRHGRARVVLLTPACFRAGAIPETLGGAKVVAAAVGRPTVVSGWDMAARGPKPTRRLAPAGSVYWVELPPELDSEAWLNQVHLNEVSDSEQDRLDGFGLAAVGVWE